MFLFKFEAIPKTMSKPLSTGLFISNDFETFLLHTRLCVSQYRRFEDLLFGKLVCEH